MDDQPPRTIGVCLGAKSMRTYPRGAMSDQLNPIVTTLVGAAIGFLSAVCAEPLRRLIWSPSLKVDFQTGPPHVVRTPEYAEIMRSANNPVPAYSSHEAIYLRVRVRNESSTVAKACRPYLVAIESKNSDGSFHPTHFADSIPLAWSCSNEVDAWSALDLSRGVNQFIDVVSTREISSGLKPGLKQLPARYQDIFSTPANLRFTIQVACENGKPQQCSFIANWNGKWDEISAEVSTE